MMALRDDGAALRAADPRSKMQDIPYLASHILHQQACVAPSCIGNALRCPILHPEFSKKILTASILLICRK